MGRKKAEQKANGHGKNDALTDDEQRALLFHHRRLWEQADASVEAAKAARKQIEHRAKAECGKSAVADIKDLILLEKDKGGEAVKAQVDRMLRLARWANELVGTQFVFEEIDKRTEDDRAFEAGKTAGLKGDKCTPPMSFAVLLQGKWIDGWHAGQAVVLSDFRDKIRTKDKPKGDKPDEGQTDLEDAVAAAKSDPEQISEGERPDDDLDVRTAAGGALARV